MGHGDSKLVLLAVAGAAMPRRSERASELLRGALRRALGALPLGPSDALLQRLAAAFRLFALGLALQRLRLHLLDLRHTGLRGLSVRAFNSLVAAAVALPGVATIVEREVGKELASVEQKMHGSGDPDAFVQLPEKGLGAAAILDLARGLQTTEIEKHQMGQGKKWAGIYHRFDGPLIDLQNQMWCMYNSSNALYEGVFPSVRKFEAEIVSWVLHLLHGDPKAGGGILASGGTEAVLIAALAYREQGRLRGIQRPRILAANTAHPAIVKACHYFGMELTKVPVEASTGFALTAVGVRPYLTSDVVAIYASAPTFPHGVVDRVEELGRLAKRHGVGLHVDNCLGGILLSYMDREGVGEPRQVWDFRASGVTSISTDVHKYGNASKGVSVVTFRDTALRQLTYVPVTDGCEGLYVTSTLQGARGGGIIAQAWATMLHVGHEGYGEYARSHAEMHTSYREAVNQIPGLRTLCASHASIVPIASDRYNIYAVASLMSDMGWNLFTGQMPPVLSICLGESHGQLLPSFEADLRAALKTLDATPDYKPKGEAAIYGAMGTTPAAILERVVRNYVDIKLSVRAAQ